MKTETENRKPVQGRRYETMTFLSCIRSNLFTLGLLLLIAGFSSSSWKSYTVYSFDNETYSGHEGLWYKYLSNDSVSCKGDLRFDTDSRSRDSLHIVRNLLAVALGFSILFLVLCTIRQCSQDEDGVNGGCLSLRWCAILVSMLLIWALVLSATLIYHQKIYADTSDYQEDSRHHSGSFFVMVTSAALLGLAAILCDWNLLTLDTTFIYAIIRTLPILVYYLYDTLPEERRGQYVSIWLLHIGVLTLFSVGMFSSSWFSMTSTKFSDVTVQMGMWTQCRDQYSLTCCSGITYFYTDTPGWFFTCRDITMVAYGMCILAAIFSFILLYVRTFRVPLLITQLSIGVTLVVSCVQYGINVKNEEGVHSHFEAAFVISVVVCVASLFFTLEFIIDTHEWLSASCQSWRERLLSWKERITLSLIHRRSRTGAQIPVSDETEETGNSQSDTQIPVIEGNIAAGRSRTGAQIPVSDETEETECNICMMNPRDTRLHPCGHTCCRACGGQLARCHICRELIQDRHIFYL